MEFSSVPGEGLRVRILLPIYLEQENHGLKNSTPASVSYWLMMSCPGCVV